MEKLKNNWLRAIMGLTLALGVGYFAVNASEKNVEAVDNIPAKTEKVTTRQQWYTTDATGQFIVSMLSTPPLNVGGPGCDQQNSGEYCAKLLEFDVSVDPADLENKSISEIEQDVTPIDEIGAAKHRN